MAGWGVSNAPDQAPWTPNQTTWYVPPAYQQASQNPNPFRVPTAPPAVKPKAATTQNPFVVDQNKISANRKKNPFLVSLTPSADLFGINIPV